MPFFLCLSKILFKFYLSTLDDSVVTQFLYQIRDCRDSKLERELIPGQLHASHLAFLAGFRVRSYPKKLTLIRFNHVRFAGP